MENLFFKSFFIITHKGEQTIFSGHIFALPCSSSDRRNWGYLLC